MPVINVSKREIVDENKEQIILYCKISQIILLERLEEYTFEIPQGRLDLYDENFFIKNLNYYLKYGKIPYIRGEKQKIYKDKENKKYFICLDKEKISSNYLSKIRANYATEEKRYKIFFKNSKLANRMSLMFSSIRKFIKKDVEDKLSSRNSIIYVLEIEPDFEKINLSKLGMIVEDGKVYIRENRIDIHSVQDIVAESYWLNEKEYSSTLVKKENKINPLLFALDKERNKLIEKSYKEISVKTLLKIGDKKYLLDLKDSFVASALSHKEYHKYFTWEVVEKRVIFYILEINTEKNNFTKEFLQKNSLKSLYFKKIISSSN